MWSLREIIKELIQYRDLLFALVAKDIKIRYKQTAMGFLWAIFMPMLIVASGVIVKKAMAFVANKPFTLDEVVSVSVKSLPWAFFVGALKFAVGSLTANMNLVKKIYFPREVFPIAYVIAQFYDFAIASIILAIILIIAKVHLTIYFLWLPVIILFLVLFTIALSLILSCANLFFRDVKYITDVILTFGIFFTPVFFEAKMFSKYEIFFMLNPVGSMLENINTIIVLQKPPDLFWVGYAGVISILGFLFSCYVFHKNEPNFAENI